MILLISNDTYAFDIIGLQPLAPNGVFSTFSAESLPENKFSLEIGAERSRESDFYRFSLKGAYGITDNLEFNLMIPYVYNYSGSIDGLEDISFGFKHRFYDEGKYGPSLAYLINASLSTGHNGLSTNGRIGIGFILSKRVGPFSGHLNIFYEKPGTEKLKDEISFAGGIEFSASHNFEILGEIYTKKGHFTNEYDQIEARLGYRIKTTDYVYTTIGVGLDLKKRNPEYRVMLSVSLTTPHAKKKIKKIYEEE